MRIGHRGLATIGRIDKSLVLAMDVNPGNTCRASIIKYITTGGLGALDHRLPSVIPAGCIQEDKIDGLSIMAA
jgi:hypothetical protein